jgi:hypothetical protein
MFDGFDIWCVGGLEGENRKQREVSNHKIKNEVRSAGR